MQIVWLANAIFLASASFLCYFFFVAIYFFLRSPQVYSSPHTMFRLLSYTASYF
jgi:hypothetical protein